MKLLLSALCLLSAILQCSSYEMSYRYHMKIPLDLPDLQRLPNASLEDFPYHVMVKGTKTCNGILISEDFVITPAVCVYGAKRVWVFLGYQIYPIRTNATENPNGKMDLAAEVKIHPDFIRVDDYRYLNNIALVKLSVPTHIKPAKLATKHFIDQALSDNAKANVTGWMQASKTNLMLAEVKLRNQDTCRILFGPHLFVDQELCVRWPTMIHMNLLGNPVSINNEVIGFQTLTPECLVPVTSCSRNDLIMSLAAFIGWISEHTQLSIEDFTNHRHGYEDKFLYKLVEELKASQVDRLSGIKAQLYEQVNDMRSEMRNSQEKVNAAILKLQQETADARTQITDGLTAAKADIGNITKLIEEPTEMILNVEKNLGSVESDFEALSAKVDNFEVEIHKVQVEASIIQGTLHNLSHNFSHLSDHVHHSALTNKDNIDVLEMLIENKYKTLLSTSIGNKARLDETCDRLNLLETAVTEDKTNFDEKLMTTMELFKASLKELATKASDCCAFEMIPAN